MSVLQRVGHLPCMDDHGSIPGIKYSFVNFSSLQNQDKPLSTAWCGSISDLRGYIKYVICFFLLKLLFIVNHTFTRTEGDL